MHNVSLPLQGKFSVQDKTDVAVLELDPCVWSPSIDDRPTIINKVCAKKQKHNFKQFIKKCIQKLFLNIVWSTRVLL